MIKQIRDSLKKDKKDAYILYDFKSQNKVLTKLLDIKQVPTRRIVYVLDAAGDDMLIIPAMEQEIFADFKDISKIYASQEEFSILLENKISGYKDVVLDFDEDNFSPEFDIVPYGFVTFLKKLNPNLNCNSSLQFIEPFLGNWGPVGYDLHISASAKLKEIFDAATLELQGKMDSGITEFEIREFILKEFKKRNLVSNRYGCLVASGPNSSNPHYIPTKQINRKICKDELVLIDLWAKEDMVDSIYADNTFIIWIGDNIPPEVIDIWQQVKKARDMATKFLQDNMPTRAVKGFEADLLIRNYFKSKSVDKYFTHRLGHSLDTSVHGLGTHLDSFESYDDRSLNKNCGFTIEPGLYLPGKFGIRSEINAYIAKDGSFEVTSWMQDEIVKII